jgi:NADP-dependent 3-hydroxy acid dehydrogenase YdfG
VSRHHISSVYANAGTAGSGVCSATKAAVVVLSDSLRKEARGSIKVTVVRPTGALGTGLASGVVNPATIEGMVGHHQDRYVERLMAMMDGTLDQRPLDIDEPTYWAIVPDVIATEVLHAIDQPWGVTISDVTMRATGEDFVV